MQWYDIDVLDVSIRLCWALEESLNQRWKRDWSKWFKTVITKTSSLLNAAFHCSPFSAFVKSNVTHKKEKTPERLTCKGLRAVIKHGSLKHCLLLAAFYKKQWYKWYLSCCILLYTVYSICQNDWQEPDSVTHYLRVNQFPVLCLMLQMAKKKKVLCWTWKTL